MTSQEENESKESEKELVEVIISKLPESLRKKVNISVQYSGPLPPASQYDQYEKTFAGSADRILKLAETEQSIRKQGLDIQKEGLEIRRLEIQSSTSLDRSRIRSSTLVSVGLLVIAFYAIWTGNMGAGITFGAIGVISSAAKFILEWAQTAFFTSSRIEDEEENKA